MPSTTVASTSSSPSKEKPAKSDHHKDAEENAVHLTKVIIYANVQRPHTLACIQAMSAQAFQSTQTATTTTTTTTTNTNPAAAAAEATTHVTIITPKDAISLLHDEAAAAASTSPTNSPYKTPSKEKGQEQQADPANSPSVRSTRSASSCRPSRSLSALPFLRLWEKENKDVLSKVQDDTPLLQQMEFYIVESEREGHNKTLQTDAELSYAVFKRQMPTLCILHGPSDGTGKEKKNFKRKNRNAVEALLYQELYVQEDEGEADNTTAADDAIKQELAQRFFWFPKQRGVLAAVESNLFVRDVVPSEKGTLPNHSLSDPNNLHQQQHGEFYMKCVRSVLSLLHKHHNSKVVCVRGDGCPFFLKSCEGEDEGHVVAGEQEKAEEEKWPAKATTSSLTKSRRRAEEEFLLMPPTKFNTLLYQNIIDRMTTTTATTSSDSNPPVGGKEKKAEGAEKEEEEEKKRETETETEKDRGDSDTDDDDDDEPSDQATKDAEAIIQNTLKSIQLQSKNPQLCGAFFPLNRYENRHILRYLLLKGHTVIAIDHFSSMARELAHTVSLRNFDTSLLSSAFLLHGDGTGGKKKKPSGSPTSQGQAETPCKASSRSSSSGTAVSTSARDRGAPPPPPPPIIHEESDNMKRYRQFCSADNLSNLFYTVPNGSFSSSNNNSASGLGGSGVGGGGAASDPLRILAFYMNLKKEDVDLYIQCIRLVQALERQWLRLPQPQHHLILQQPSHGGAGNNNGGSSATSMSNYLSPVIGSGSTRYHTSLSFSSISSCGGAAANATGASGNPLSSNPNWLNINPGLMLRQFSSLWLSSLLDVHDPKTGLVRLCEVALEDPQVVVLRHQRDAFAGAAAVTGTTPLETTGAQAAETTVEERSAVELDAIFEDWMLRVLKQSTQ